MAEALADATVKPAGAPGTGAGAFDTSSDSGPAPEAVTARTLKV